jgi:hypothetical protein
MRHDRVPGSSFSAMIADARTPLGPNHVVGADAEVVVVDVDAGCVVDVDVVVDEVVVVIVLDLACAAPGVSAHASAPKKTRVRSRNRRPEPVLATSLIEPLSPFAIRRKVILVDCRGSVSTVVFSVH